MTLRLVTDSAEAVGLTLTDENGVTLTAPDGVTLTVAQVGPQGPAGDGGDATATWEVDWIGSIGPGFDVLVPSGALGPTAWGPDYLLAQYPWGELFTVQASEGDVLACANYLNGSYASVPTNETLWTLTGGVWVKNTGTNAPSNGDRFVLRDWTRYPGLQGDARPWSLGTTATLSGVGVDQHIEGDNLQFTRSIIGMTTAFQTVTSDGTDEALSGAPLGTVFIDASGGNVQRTPSDNLTPGRTLTYVRVDNSGNTVTIAGVTGATSPYSLPSQWDRVRVTFDGTDWIVVDKVQSSGGGSGDVTGPSSSVNGRAAIFSGTTGKVIAQASAAPMLVGDAPTAHKTSHATGGTDALAPSDIGAVPTTRTINGYDLSANRSLTASDVSAAPTTRTITAGTGLTGGGDLSADRTLAVSYGTTAGTAAQGNDSRLTDSRAPSGSAGGDLTGTYPNPTVATGLAVSKLANGTRGQALIGGASTPEFRFITTSQAVPAAANDWVPLWGAFGSGTTTSTVGGTATASNSAARYLPFFVGKRIGVTGLGIEVAVGNAGASAVIRMGIHNDSSGRPGTVVQDAGTATAAAAAKEITFTEVFLDTGWYWAVVAFQSLDTAGTNPTLRCANTFNGSPAPRTAVPAASGQAQLFGATVSGALAANPTVSAAATAIVPCIWLKVSTP